MWAGLIGFIFGWVGLVRQGDHEVSRAVRPRPGRVVFFTGGVLHSARPPLPDVVEPRYSIVLKFWLEPVADDYV